MSGAGLRQALARLVARLLTRAYLRVRVEGLEHLPPGGAVLCFSHANWADPIVLLAVLPPRPTTYFFGPLEADMSRGVRNRLIALSALAVPAPPGRPLAALRRAEAILARGERLAIAGEGRIHAREREILPLLDGPAHLAIRAGVPLVPVAIIGTTWLALGRRVRIRIGRPIVPPRGPARRAAVDALSEACRNELLGLVADAPDLPPPGPVGRWLTDLFNDWPGGRRP
ncbi:MAG TPA: lysophospholipid acyltransferase family protein [Candidatus Binatia bacterium]|nr:lysophospholipid acyltransferase family protein [Candidatus Binatia bacterium]